MAPDGQARRSQPGTSGCPLPSSVSLCFPPTPPGRAVLSGMFFPVVRLEGGTDLSGSQLRGTLWVWAGGAPGTPRIPGPQLPSRTWSCKCSTYGDWDTSPLRLYQMFFSHERGAWRRQGLPAQSTQRRAEPASLGLPSDPCPPPGPHPESEWPLSTHPPPPTPRQPRQPTAFPTPQVILEPEAGAAPRGTEDGRPTEQDL